jgi:predicted nucleic acid-binding protein
MMLYFDTSYLYRIYSFEPGHEAVKNLLKSKRCSVFSGWHARAEFAAITLRKRREQPTDTLAFNIIHKQFLSDCAAGFIKIEPFTEPVIHRVESVIASAPAQTFLRAADALHLACAAEHGFTEIYSNDRHFLAAAPVFGLCGVNVIE